MENRAQGIILVLQR